MHVYLARCAYLAVEYSLLDHWEALGKVRSIRVVQHRVLLVVTWVLCRANRKGRMVLDKAIYAICVRIIRSTALTFGRLVDKHGRA